MHPTLISLITFAGIASSTGAVLLGAKDLFAPRRQQTPSLRGNLHRTSSSDANRGDGLLVGFDRWLERTLYLARPGIDSLTATLIMLLTVIAIGGGVYVATEHLPLTIAASMATIVMLLGVMIFAGQRRLKQFQRQFPASLDLLARAVRAGESIENGLELVADAVKGPVSHEFHTCTQQLQMGLSMPATMKALTERIRLMDVRIFGNALSVHRQSGGSVAVTVERLAEVIRDRMEYHQKLKSVTGAGRLSVLLILALGPILFAHLFLFQPEYGIALWTDPVGRWMLLAAGISQFIGLVWVMQVLKKDY